MTSDTGEQLRFWAHCQLAWFYYHSQGIISHEKFDEMDWWSVCKTMHDLPRLFQIWAAKHVNNIAGTMSFLSYQYDRQKSCPSCQTCEETCWHIARCPEAGHTLAFEQSSNDMAQWLNKKKHTHPDMHELLLWYLCCRGTITRLDCSISLDLSPIMQELAILQERIGWDLFIMGMVSKQLVKKHIYYNNTHRGQHHHGSRD